MLALQSWRHHAEGLDVGRTVRVDHDCGTGRTLIVVREPTRYRAWCHRCNEPGFDDGPEETQAEKLARLIRQRDGDATVAASTELPEPQVRDVGEWPAPYRLWLYKAGLGRDLIGRLGAYYHPPSDRVVLPVLEGGRAVYWQARALNRFPKYMAPTPKPANTLARWGRAEVVTLTEDMLSAFKVGLDHEGWAILGTSISDHMLSELLKRGPRVNLWTDPDAAGRKAAAKYYRQLSAYGLTVRSIQSTRDPKLTHRGDMKELLA